jgi:hypothetical protein
VRVDFLNRAKIKYFFSISTKQKEFFFSGMISLLSGSMEATNGGSAKANYPYFRVTNVKSTFP